MDKEELSNGLMDVAEENATPSSKGKKSKKSKKDADWEDDVARELEEMTLEESGGKTEENEKTPSPVPEPKSKKKETKKSKKAKAEESDEEEEEEVVTSKKGGGFAALMMDDDDDDDDDDDRSDEEPVKQKKAPPPKKENKKKEEKPKPQTPAADDKKKGGKKGKKGKKDEDLDAILAEFAAENQAATTEEPPAKEDVPSTPAGDEAGKKKKKKKKNVDESIIENDAENHVPVEEMDTTPAPQIVNDQELAKEEAKDDTPKVKAKAKRKPKETAADQQKPEDAPSPADAETADKPVEKEITPEPAKEITPEPAKEQKETLAEDGAAPEDGESSKKKKKKKKKEEKEEPPQEKEKKKEKGKPGNKALAAMREILAKQKEEEERLRKEEDERIKKEEEELKRIEEEQRLEQERKDRKKQKEKERKERLKAEGKLLTPKQKAEQRRAQEMLEYLRAQGVDLPGSGEKKTPRLGTKLKKEKKTKKDEKTEGSENDVEQKPEPVVEKPAEVESTPAPEPPPEVVKEEEVKDAWDISSDEDEAEVTEAPKEDKIETPKKQISFEDKEEEDEEDDDDESEEESEEEEDEEHKNEAERRRQRAVDRIGKRKEDNLKLLDIEVLRAPVVCVLGHVDHGKTKILDKLRRTNVQEGEVGGITQQIGATNVPADAVKKQTHMVKDFDMSSLKFPGLLIIDTPGHESFRNLRSRGSSLCDIAILVVDVTQGLEPQTKESIELLRKKQTPFLVALNKVDRVYEWDSHPSKDIREILNLQAEHSKNDFERRTAQVIQGLREVGLNSALFWENPNPKEYISLVPTSAISGDGMGNLMSLICNMCQNRLSKQLMFSEELQCTVLEVKTIQGHGTTIDIILVNGRLREGDTIVLAGTEGPIVTQIRSLLLPKPMKEIRVKGQYDEFREISAAQGVKIAARDLEKAIAGLTLRVAYHEDEIDIIKQQVDLEFKAAMRSIKVKDRGVYVQASTLGALEALLEFFKVNKVPYSGIRVGPVVKKDVMKAAAMLEHDPMYAVILAFDVKVDKDAQELADKEGVKIFSEETIYHLGDRYVEYIKAYKKKKQDEFRSVAVFPCKLKIIPTAIFNKRDPIVLGVTVDSGLLRTGTPLCVPSKEFVEIGVVTSMEFDHKQVDIAKKGIDVCIKIEPVGGHTPKLFGRHFEADDLLVSKISRDSINACKDHFRDDLSKTDWKLMADLKKQFQIL